MAEQQTPQPCTNYSLTRRHYSTGLRPRPYAHRGLQGEPLCSSAATVYDETAVNDVLAAYRQGRQRIVVAELPECKPCVQAIAEMEAGRG